MHCIFCVISRVARPVLEGPHWVPRRWCQEGSRNWLPDVDASVSLALDELIRPVSQYERMRDRALRLINRPSN